jgi:glucose/arabinose dehydrogenase
MTTRSGIASIALASALALAPAFPHASDAATPLHTIRIAQGLSFPLYVTAPPGDTTRLFIVERRGADNRGRVKIWRNGAVLARPFLTTQVLASGNEQGLLGLAFAPDYATTGRFYINYTQTDGTVTVERRQVSADPDSAQPAGVPILTITHPQSNHNGGWLGFGPDGYLYVAVGDGGGSNDTDDNAQNLGVLLGKILRLDVSGATYTSPPSNPFAGPITGLDEIWAYGLRNPWRPSFDKLTGDLIIADVGQNLIEEVDFQPASSTGGENYGWRCYEGPNFFSESTTIPCGSCLAPGCPKVFPAYSYDHSGGRCSVTGGFVYRGCAIPDLQGQYFFADYCVGQIYTGRFEGGLLVDFANRTAELAPGGGLSIATIPSFGQDARGELYICDGDGEIYKIVPETPVAEADMPVLQRGTQLGDVIGSTTPGNALLPGITPFVASGSRVRGVGYVKSAGIRECANASAGCLASRLRLWPYDVDFEACVDSIGGKLTRRFIFTNKSATPQPLAFVDAITPQLNGNEDGAMTESPANSNQSATLVLYDSFQPTRYIRHWGTASAGGTYSADVDTAAQLDARIAQDVPLAGGTTAGPAALGLALGFDFGSVAAAASETVTVYTIVQGGPPTPVEETPPPSRVLRVGPVPFRTELTVELTLATAKHATVDVYDIHGRLVRRIVERPLSAGANRFVWDGRTDAGNPAAAGIYFIRYEGGDATEVRRAVRMR